MHWTRVQGARQGETQPPKLFSTDRGSSSTDFFFFFFLHLYKPEEQTKLSMNSFKSNQFRFSADPLPPHPKMYQ